MEPKELPDFLASEFDFPVDTATVREEVGDIEVDAPDSEDTVTIDSLLEDLGEDTYESADMLHQTLSGQLPDQFVGRKFYDDRGPNVEGDEAPRGGQDQSF